MYNPRNVLYRIGVLFLVLDCVCAWSQPLKLPARTFSPRRLQCCPTDQSFAKPQNDFFESFSNHLLRNKVQSLVLRNPRKHVHVDHPESVNLQEIQSITGRYVQLKSETKYQLAYRYRTNEQVKNFDIKDVANTVQVLVQSGVFKSALFTAANENHYLAIKIPPGATQSLYTYKVKQIHPIPDRAKCEVHIKVQNMTHDRIKNPFIAIDSPFLEALGITCKDKTPIIRPRVGMADKLRQIQKFVEILDGLVESLPDLKVNAQDCLRIADMGSGLAYLTFAVHSHFQKRFPKLQTVGVEKRAELTNRTNEIARGLGTEFKGLRFRTGRIGEIVGILPHHSSTRLGIIDVTDEINVSGTRNESPLDVLIALHACDTATDDAIMHGIAHNASIIVVSPCCHKEVRRQLEAHNGCVNLLRGTASDNNGLNSLTYMSHPLSSVLIHGIYRERHAEMVTDTLRALCLEYSGYDTKIFEFVSGEHTAKNTMIASIKSKAPLTGAKKESILRKIQDLMIVFGIQTHTLVSMLKIFG